MGDPMSHSLVVVEYEPLGDCDIMTTSFTSPAHPSPSSLSTVSGVMVTFLRPSAGRLAGFGEGSTWALHRILKILLGNGTPLSFSHSLMKWWVFSLICSKVMVSELHQLGGLKA